MTKKWESNLFSIEDIKEEPAVELVCCCCCPGFTSALAKSYHDGSAICFNWCCFPVAASRNVIRKENNIKGSWLGDCFWSCFCPCFVSRQMLHEVKSSNNEEGPIDLVAAVKLSATQIGDEVKKIEPIEIKIENPFTKEQEKVETGIIEEEEEKYPEPEL